LLAGISAAGAVVYRWMQIYLQKLPTKWHWVGNNIVAKGLLNKIVGSLFGKTTLLYNMKVIAPEAEKELAENAAKKKALEHLARKGGVLLSVYKETMNRMSR
jgi:hypothetical protein